MPQEKKHRTVKQLTNDLYNNAWNNLELSKSGKQSLYTAGGIALFGLLAAVSIMRN
jgi:hypothetical protein